MRAESQQYLASIADQQRWMGTEPGLQLLQLPSAGQEPLPRYSDRPEYLSPEHCRLCLQPVPAARLPEHLSLEHGITFEEYRSQVLAKTLAEWPQEIPWQVYRSRLAAYKGKQCDANFRIQPCASCARGKRLCKLSVAVLPSRSAASPPSWLPFLPEQWQLVRERWFDGMCTLLDPEEYLQTIFQADARVEAAGIEVDHAEAECDVDVGFASAAAARSWLERVRAWRRNVRAALLSDSVRSPYLLYASLLHLSFMRFFSVFQCIDLHKLW